jgi:hypothetical protein
LQPGAWLRSTRGRRHPAPASARPRFTCRRRPPFDGTKRWLIASLRYLDMFAKINGSWLFAERLLHVDWMEERSLS